MDIAKDLGRDPFGTHGSHHGIQDQSLLPLIFLVLRNFYHTLFILLGQTSTFMHVKEFRNVI
jgi:hypothetical protein